ncbi:hypothetical protein Tco_0574605, partial [Tanacetum coccineum]
GGRYFDGPGYYRQHPHQGYSNWPQLQAITPEAREQVEE